MSVTAVLLCGSTEVTRNEEILRDVEIEVRKAIDWPLRERFEPDFFGRRLSDEEVREKTAGRVLENAAWRCEGWRDRAVCGHVFEAGDRVARFRWGGGGRWHLKTRCAECESLAATSTYAVECEGGCGLLVVSLFYNDPRRAFSARKLYRTCSRRCTEIAAKNRQRKERELRRCEKCGEEFAPSRSDAHYCSSRCKQKAYRERLKAGAS